MDSGACSRKHACLCIQHAVFFFCRNVAAFIGVIPVVAGKFKAAELISFLSKQSGSAAGSEADDSASPGPDKGSGQKQKQEEKRDPKIVRDLNVAEFEGLSDEEDAWLVAFYSGAVKHPESSSMFCGSVCWLSPFLRTTLTPFNLDSQLGMYRAKFCLSRAACPQHIRMANCLTSLDSMHVNSCILQCGCTSSAE